jgi:tetratricopeptide (TPR) repeat protein
LGRVDAAAERYFVTIELDEEFVEARANLGCVLLEQRRLDLAVASFRGALDLHPQYPDVHYHLAQALDDLGEKDEAEEHWREFLALAPDSPWADEAEERLGSA